MAAPRWGLTIPLTGVPIRAHADIVAALPDFGYTDVWTAEINGADAFTPLALCSVWQPALRLGTAIVPTFTRGPGLIAMSAATLAAAAPGRFSLGLGASSPVVVTNWNGIAFDEPLARTRDVLRFVRSALTGERIDGAFETFAINRFRLDEPPPVVPPILLAALRPQMLALAGREADGAILNWLTATDVPACLHAIANPAATVVARIFVCPTEDRDYARAAGRALIANYLTVSAYAAFHDWLGRAELLAPMHRAWAANDRAGARAAIPDALVDALVLAGSPEHCRDQVQAYVDAGVHIPVLALLDTPEVSTPPQLLELLRRLGPASG
jgi:probable F420-dependent oxidoreductase